MDPNEPEEKSIEFAAALIKNGGLVAFSTETVYGVGANFLDRAAVKKLYRIKKRPEKKPFTIHVSDMNTIKGMGAEISPFADRLIKRFWPGPLTLIMNAKGGSLGFRMPKNGIAKSIISKSGVPVALPSANISGEKPPVDAKDVLEALDGKIDLIIDSGETEYGKESTIVGITASGYKILRKGAIPAEEIDEVYNEM